MMKAYAVINKNESVRSMSSSGGVFTLLAEEILRKNGVVFGAAFNDEMKVKHFCVKTESELYKIRGAKYVQSSLDGIYPEIKTLLEDGVPVLFTGTPCQNSGLKAYLGKEYDNLYCQDIVCHGVPMPTIWEKYKDYMRNKAGAEIKEISFRNKSSGWKRYSVVVAFKNGKIYKKRASEDVYMRAYLSDLCLRPACYNCQFKTLERQADVTLADFWGIEKIAPEMDDDKGTSLVLVHSQKGAEMLSEISGRVKLQEVDPVQAIRCNQAAVKCACKPDAADAFCNDIQENSFDKIVDKYVPKTNKIRKIIKKVVRMVKK
ncbi:MAG: (4Fe-4S)-binding protein [Ruminococcaceae bacterium]|nr:(4Fe-4S)-binding protein [Oscillospiraceae bacterium]